MNPLGAHKDRHAKIGEGHIGFEAFRRIINHPALRELPFILETPNDDAGWARGNRHAARSVRGIDVMAKSRGRFSSGLCFLRKRIHLCLSGRSRSW